jgi:phenylacetic acid degradation operon negative regulatory protein
MLVALGEQFDITPGTTRVALSRMVDRGELANDDGVYSLIGRLLERQERQDRSTQPTAQWDGTWECAIVTASGRSARERSQLRNALLTLGLGERREGVWMRPSNLEPDRMRVSRIAADAQVEWYRLAPIPVTEARLLAGQLYPLDTWATTALVLIEALTTAARNMTTAARAEGGASLERAFTLDAAARRHFVHDPLLPAELEPPGWPVVGLRQAFAHFDGELGAALRSFFGALR